MHKLYRRLTTQGRAAVGAGSGELLAAPFLLRYDRDAPCGPGARERSGKLVLSRLKANHKYLGSKDPAGSLPFRLLRAARWAKLAPLNQLAERDLARVLNFCVT